MSQIDVLKLFRDLENATLQYATAGSDPASKATSGGADGASPKPPNPSGPDPSRATKAAAAAGTVLCADGNCLNEVEAVGQGVQRNLNAFSRAAEFGIRSYNKLRYAIRGTGLQAHHIVEKRFASTLNIKSGRIPSIALTPEEHQLFTNAWRDAIGYAKSGNELNTLTATAEQIWAAAQNIYAQHPELLEAARQTIFDLPGG